LDFNGTRIYFGPCGIGLGHVGRTIPIAKEIERLGAEVLFSTYLEAVEFVKQEGLPVVKSPPIDLVSDSTGRINLKATALNQGVPALSNFMRQITCEMEFMKAFKPDVVVSDSRLSTLVAGKLLRLPLGLIINQFRLMVPSSELGSRLTKIIDGSLMTILSSGWGSSDLIFIPDFPMPNTICVDSLRIPLMYKDKVRMTGYILEKKPEDIEDVEDLRTNLGVLDNEQIIYAAISGPQRERDPLLRILEPIFVDFPNKYKIVLSMGIPGGGSSPIKKGRITKIPWVQNRYQYLKASDLIVCRGGHNTIMQAICYRKPSIIIPTPNHTEQYANARRAKELGFSDALHQKDISKNKMLGLIEQVFYDQGYTKRLNEISSKGYSNGLKNIVKGIHELLT
jgi:uncharacterized protein (TIGR00661 family)